MAYDSIFKMEKDGSLRLENGHVLFRTQLHSLTGTTAHIIFKTSSLCKPESHVHVNNIEVKSK